MIIEEHQNHLRMENNAYSGIDIAEIIRAKLYSQNPESIAVNDILIDSRRLISSDSTLFFALIGKNNDGHNYIKDRSS